MGGVRWREGMFSVDANPPNGQQGASGLHRSVTFTLFNSSLQVSSCV